MRFSKFILPIFLACLALGYIFSHVSRLQNFPIGGDESCSLGFVSNSNHFADIFYETRQGDAHPPLYNIILFGIDRAVGLTLPAARWPSLLAGAASLVLIFFFGFKMEAGMTCLIMALMFWASGASELFSTFARSYAVVFFLATCVWCIYLYYFKTGKFLTGPLFAACLIGLYGHYFFLALMTSIALFVLMFPDKDLRIRTFKVFAAAFIGFLPWVVFWGGYVSQSMELVGNIYQPSFEYLKDVFFSLYYPDVLESKPIYEIFLFSSFLWTAKKFVFEKFDGPIFSRLIPMRYWALAIVLSMAVCRAFYHEFWLISVFAFALILFDLLILKIFAYRSSWDHLGGWVLVGGFLIFFRKVYFYNYLSPILFFTLISLVFIFFTARMSVFVRLLVLAQVGFSFILLPYFFNDSGRLLFLLIPFLLLKPNFKKIAQTQFELPSKVLFTFSVYTVVLLFVLGANFFSIPVTKMRYLEVIRFGPLYLISLAMAYFMRDLVQQLRYLWRKRNEVLNWRNFLIKKASHN